jgi:hypothetical protein
MGYILNINFSSNLVVLEIIIAVKINRYSIMKWLIAEKRGSNVAQKITFTNSSQIYFEFSSIQESFIGIVSRKFAILLLVLLES